MRKTAGSVVRISATRRGSARRRNPENISARYGLMSVRTSVCATRPPSAVFARFFRSATPSPYRGGDRGRDRGRPLGRAPPPLGPLARLRRDGLALVAHPRGEEVLRLLLGERREERLRRFAPLRWRVHPAAERRAHAL